MARCCGDSTGWRTRRREVLPRPAASWSTTGTTSMRRTPTAAHTLNTSSFQRPTRSSTLSIRYRPQPWLQWLDRLGRWSARQPSVTDRPRLMDYPLVMTKWSHHSSCLVDRIGHHWSSQERYLIFHNSEYCWVIIYSVIFVISMWSVVPVISEWSVVPVISEWSVVHVISEWSHNPPSSLVTFVHLDRINEDP